jgi:4'-phosphopantetheinyl transferase
MSLVNIRNLYLEDITWLAPGSGDFNINGYTDIWRISIGANLSFLDSLGTLINAAEKERAKRYLQARDRNRFVISRGALRIILARYLDREPSLIEFETGANKKPFLKDTPLHYNVSHSGDWIMIAVANNPVGADVERVDPAFDYQDIIAEYFSPEEAKYILEEDSHFRFFLLWTRKEALTKATGKGLDDDLKFIPALNGEHAVEPDLLRSTSGWQVNSFELSPGYFAACVIPESADRLCFRDADLSKNRL